MLGVFQFIVNTHGVDGVCWIFMCLGFFLRWQLAESGTFTLFRRMHAGTMAKEA